MKGLAKNHSFCVHLRLLHRCIGRWLAERSATCPLCKTELFEEVEEDSSDEEEDNGANQNGRNQQPGNSNGWQQLLDLLNFGLEGGSENLITATANRPPQQQQPQREETTTEDLSSEPSFWRRWLIQRRGRRRRTLAEEHGVTLNALSEPLLQAENGEADTIVEETPAEPRPDPPEGGAPQQE